jgi:hypothetical protein
MGRNLQVLVLPHKILVVVVVVPLEVAEEEHLGSFQVEEQHCQGSLHTEVFLVVHSLNLEGICFQGLHTSGCGLQEQDIQVDHTEKEIKNVNQKIQQYHMLEKLAYYQGDQTSLQKKFQKCSPAHFLPKLIPNF